MERGKFTPRPEGRGGRGVRGGGRGGGEYNNFGNRGGDGQKPRFGGNRNENEGSTFGLRGGRGGGGNFGAYQGGDRGDRQSRGGFNKENNYQGNREGGFDGGFKKRGGDFGNTSMMSGGSHFSKKPNNSLVAIGVNPEDAKVQKQKFYTNQFKMKIGTNAPQVYQYPMNLFPGEPEDIVDDGNSSYQPQDVGKVVDREKSRIELLCGKFVYSGFNLWTLQRLEQDLIIKSRFMGHKVCLKIDHAGEHETNTCDIHNPNRQDCQSMSMFLNVVTKQAMAETGLLQFGIRPRFFDPTQPIHVPELEMQIW
jgi:hypothetical protein